MLPNSIEVSIKGVVKRKHIQVSFQKIYLLIGKDSEAGRDWGQEEKGTTEDEMAGWHH